MTIVKAAEHPTLQGVDLASKPRVYWVHCVQPKQDARVILKAGSYALLVAGRYGKGKVMVFRRHAMGAPAGGQTPFWQWKGWTGLVGRVGRLARRQGDQLMRHLWPIALFACVTPIVAASEAPVTIVRVRPTKIRFMVGETGRAHVILKNNTQVEQKGVLTVTERWDLDESRDVWSGAVTLGPGQGEARGRHVGAG